LFCRLAYGRRDVSDHATSPGKKLASTIVVNFSPLFLFLYLLSFPLSLSILSLSPSPSSFTIKNALKNNI